MIEQVLALADSWGSYFIDTDRAESEHPTNRHAPATDTEERLLRLLDQTRAIWARDARPAEVDAPGLEAFA